MKAKVLRRFRDKKTNEFYAQGAVYEGSAERVKEIHKKGFLDEIIEDDKKSSVKEGEKDGGKRSKKVSKG